MASLRWLCIVLLFPALRAVEAQEPAVSSVEGVPVHIEVRDSAGAPMPCRVHLSDGTDALYAPVDGPAFKNHFSCDGTARLTLPPGRYTYAIERGPEFSRATGEFTIAGGEPGRQVMESLVRIADLAGEGWWSGDLHIHRPPEQIETIMRAEDLHVAPVITWWNQQNRWREQPVPERVLVPFDRNRYYHLMAGEDERGGGAFLFFNLSKPIDIAGAERNYPCQAWFLTGAREQSAWVDLEKPYWWDAPIGIGLGQVDSVGIANNHMWRHGMLDNEAWGRPRLRETEPPAHANGHWVQEIYYHILNAGLRIPPSAGSASGVIPNPAGYNRVYVKLDGPLEYAAWWEGLRAGRSFVTNGPLLRVQANGMWPGHVFRSSAGETLSIALTGQLACNDSVRHLQIIKNGEIAAEVAPEALGQAGGMPALTFTESGWFLIRAIADVDFTFRFASTAPYYVEIGGEPMRPRRQSVQFFLDWIDERNRQLELPPEQLAEVLDLHDRARTFWEQKLAEAR